MRLLLSILLLLAAVACLADRRGLLIASASHAASSGGGGSWTDPSGSNTLFAWWAAADTTNGQKLGDTNPWPDRVQTILLRDAALNHYPLSTSTGVLFSGTQALTNAPLSLPSSNHSVCIICAPNSTANKLLWSPYDGGDAAQAVHKDGFFTQNNDFYWGTAFVGGSAISGTLTVAQIYDLVAVQSGGTITFYTNGVQSASLSRIPLLTGWPWQYLGGDENTAAWFSGVVKDVFVWTNAFNSVQLSNVHYYATNTYAYSP